MTPRRLLLATCAVLTATLAATWLTAPPAQSQPGGGLFPRLLVEGASTVDWAPKGDWIAYDRLDSSGYSHLYVARPDGAFERCLTCDPIGLRKLHAGNPTWHPSGDYLVFEAERPVKIGGRRLPFRSVPGGHRGNALWAIRFDGKGYWNLTDRGGEGPRVGSPRFSHEGDRLVWTERLGSGGGTWGRWSLQVADFAVKRGVPRLSKAERYRPGAGGFYESYGFTPDDGGILFGANYAPGQPEGELDLFVMRLDTGDVEALTRSAALDRFARITPDGRRVVWASNQGIGRRGVVFERSDRTSATPMDLWAVALGNPKAGSAVRLTRFNDVTTNEYFGRVMVGAPAWSRDGDRAILPLTQLVPGGLFGEPALYLIETDELLRGVPEP